MASRTADPSLCVDCGADTTPCTKRRGCRHAGRWEWYMVWPTVWAAAGMDPDGGYLCIACLETRLGRPLDFFDFTRAPINDPLHPWMTPRLAAAMQRLPRATLRGRTTRFYRRRTTA